MRRDPLQTGRSAWRRLLASTLVVVPIWWGLAGSVDDRASVADRAASGDGVAGSSVFTPGQGPSAAPDHAMLSASDVERALPPPSRTATVGFESNRS
jgi:hypothetical protein